MSKTFGKTHIPLDKIDDNPYQSRLDVGDLEGLAETILSAGLQSSPPGRVVSEDGDLVKTQSSVKRFAEEPDGYHSFRVQLGYGHRRTEAVRHIMDAYEEGGVLGGEQVTEERLQSAGLKPGRMPVVVRMMDDGTMLDVLTIENAQREGLSDVEKARLIGELEANGRTNKQIADQFGRSPSWVSNLKRLLELPQRVQMAVHEGRVSVRQAQALRDAYALKEEYPEAMEASMHDPDGLFDSAKNGTKQSDDIRREVARWEREITSDENDSTDDDQSGVSERVRAKFSDATDLPCAFCGAEAAEPCTTREGGETNPHSARANVLEAKIDGRLEYEHVSAGHLHGLIDPPSTEVEYDADMYTLGDLVAAHQILRGYDSPTARNGHKARARKIRVEMQRRVDPDGNKNTHPLSAEEVVKSAPKSLRDRLDGARTMDLEDAIQQVAGWQAGDGEGDGEENELPEDWTWQREGKPASGPWSFQATRKADEIEGTDVFFRAHGLTREQCISHAKSFDALDEVDFARLTGFNLPEDAVWCSSRIKDGSPVWCIHAGGLGEGVTTDEDSRSLKYVVQRAWESSEEPAPEPTELPEEWEWRDSCAEATVYEDHEPGPSAVRHWGTANGAPVRSRVSAGQKEKIIERAHQHEHNLSWAFLRAKLDGTSKPSLPDGWVWEVTVLKDGDPRISPFRYKGEPTCPAGWSASADGEDIYERAKEAIRIEDELESSDQDDDPDRDRTEAETGAVDTAGAREEKDSGAGEMESGTADRSTSAGEGEAESPPAEELTGELSGDGAPATQDVDLSAVGGYLAACQNLLTLHDQPSMVVDMLSESGYDRQVLVKEQKSHGFKTKKMLDLIDRAFEKPSRAMPRGNVGDGVDLAAALDLLTCDFGEIEQHLWEASLPTAAAAYRCADASARKSRIRQRFEDEGVSDSQAWYEQEASEEQRDAIDIACSRLKRRSAEEGGADEEAGQDEGAGTDDTADVGEVEPTLIEHLLSTEPEVIEGSHAIDSASIASLYVAHQVAQERGEEGREAVIAGEYTRRNVQIDPDDIPAETWDAIEAEIASYETEEGDGQIADIDVGLNAETVRALVDGAPAIRDSDEVPTEPLVVASWVKDDAHALEQRVRHRTGKTNVAVVYAEMDEPVQEEMQAVKERVMQDLQTEGAAA